MKKKVVAILLTAFTLGVISVGCQGTQAAVTEEKIVAEVINGTEEEKEDAAVKEGKAEKDHKKSEEKVTGAFKKQEITSEKEEVKSEEKAASEETEEKKDKATVKSTTDTKTAAGAGSKTTEADLKEVAEESKTASQTVTAQKESGQTTPSGSVVSAKTTTTQTTGQNAQAKPQTTQTQQTTTDTTATTPSTTSGPKEGDRDGMMVYKDGSWELDIDAANAQLDKEFADSSEDQNYTVTSRDNKELFDEINRYREENGLNPIEWSDELSDQANTRAQEQTDNVYNNNGNMDHDYGTEHSGRENLSSEESGDTLEAWMNSGGHNDLLLDPNITKGAVSTGGIDGGDGTSDGVTSFIAE